MIFWTFMSIDIIPVLWSLLWSYCGHLWIRRNKNFILLSFSFVNV